MLAREPILARLISSGKHLRELFHLRIYGLVLQYSEVGYELHLLRI